jgi:SAM-dependent methyltransferase
MRNVKFVQGDPAKMDFVRPFDAIVGRLVLMYYPNPVETIRNLSRHLRPGGLLVFQEIDVANCGSYPPAPIFDRAVAWIKAAFSATGARIEQGLELYPLFLAAGLPAPSLRLDSLIGGGPDCVAYEHIAGVVRSLLPAIEMLKIATASEIQISSLAQRIRDEVVAQEAVVLSPALIGAWSRKVHIEG